MRYFPNIVEISKCINNVFFKINYRVDRGEFPRKKRGSERVFPRVMHIIQSETSGETLGKREKSRENLAKSLTESRGESLG